MSVAINQDPFRDSDDLPLSHPRRRDYRFWLKAALVVGAVGWLLVGFVVAPLLIRSGYHQTSIDAVNRVFEHRDTWPLSFYLVKWFKAATALLIGWVGFFGLILLFDSQAFARRFVPPATPGTIGVIRAMLCLILMWYPLASDVLPAVARMPPETRRPMGALDFFFHVPGFEQLVQSESALRVFCWVLLTVLAMGAVGLFTRVVLPIAAVMFFCWAGLIRAYSWYFHNGLIPLYMVVILCLSPGAADGWSVDRLWRIWRGKPVPPSDEPTYRYGWVRYVLWMALALPYLEAGLSKIRNTGIMWWHARYMRYHLSESSVTPNSSGNTTWTLALDTAPDWFFSGMGLAALLGELSMVLVLFFWTARMVLPAVTFGMHLGIWFFQKILFPDLMLLQSIFYDWRKIRLWVGGKVNARRGPIVVRYAASSPRAGRLVQILHGLDLLGRLTFEPGEAFAVEKRGGRVLNGTAGFRAAFWATPMGWVLAPLAFVIAPAGARVLNGDRRTEATAAVTAAPAYAEPRPMIPLLRPVAITLLLAVLGGVWVRQLEWFPLTAMQMFSKPPKTQSVLYHYKVLATHADGRVRPIDLGQTIEVRRYWNHVRDAWDYPDRRPVTEKFLLSVARYYNQAKATGPDDQITRIDVQRWKWDFQANPDDPNRGHPVDELGVEVPGEYAMK